VLVELLADGERVRTPVGTFGLALRRPNRTLEHRGLRNRLASNEPGMPEIHPGRLRVSFREERSFMERVRDSVRMSRVPAFGDRVPGAPQVRSLERDFVPGSTPRLAEGELVELTGGGLSFDAADPELGVFLLPLEAKARSGWASTATSGRIRCSSRRLPPRPDATTWSFGRGRPAPACARALARQSCTEGDG